MRKQKHLNLQNKKEPTAIGSNKNNYHLNLTTTEGHMFFSLEILNVAAAQIGYEVFREVPLARYDDLFEAAEDLALEN